MSTYNLGRILPVFKGEYDPNETYSRLDVVYVETKGSYVSQENNNTSAPDTDDSWVLLNKDVTNSAAWETFIENETQREETFSDFIEAQTIRVNNTISGAESEIVQIGQEWNTLKSEMEQYQDDVDQIESDLTAHTGNLNIHCTLADKQRWDAASGGTQVQSDWNENDTESMAFIKNKPTIPSLTGYATESWVQGQNYLTSHQSIKTINSESIVGTGNLVIPVFSGDYEDLTNKPTIPSKTSDLTNDSGFLTSHQSLTGYATETWVQNQGYLTSHQNLKTINGNSIVGTGDLTITIPTKTSDLTNDSGFLTSHQELKTINNQSIVGTGNIEISGGSGRDSWYGTQAQFDAIGVDNLDPDTDYYISGNIDWNDIGNKPVIATKTSDLTNDSNFTPISQVKDEISRAARTIRDRNVYLTQSEFDALQQAGQLNENFTYYIEGDGIQANWNETDTTSAAYIQNKPTIPSLTGYATETWVQNQNYLTTHQSLKTINNQSIVGTGDLTITIPTKTSDLTNDSGFLTSHQSLKTINSESLVGSGNITVSTFSGSYNDLTNKPTIPSTTVAMEVTFTDQTTQTYNVYVQ